MKRVRWGILGAGRIANQFANDIRFAPNAELTAVAARSGESAIKFAEEYGIDHAYAGYDALMASSEIDAIYIATPHNLHIDQTKRAMAAGKAVLCEKPLVVNSRECEELVAFARAEGQYLMEAMWTWFLPALRKAKQWVDEGRIGKIRHVKADFGYPIPYSNDRREYDNRLAGGCLLEMGIYPVAIAQYFLQDEPQDLSVRAHLAPNGVEDDVVITADYAQGAVASLATSFRCKLQNWAYIIGEEGYIAIPDFWRADECSLFKLDERVDHFKDDRPGLGFEFEIIAASADILARKAQSDIVSHEASLAFQRVMERIKKHFM
ncbi:oxidoreductase [Microbulbifer agarilyticus]|uniref:Oxidoreductase n=1 Tax=Microbulbifer agarilyticus TaxID=260552 RepID=A0A1Q2M0U7_9GAMM|nr:Gfo/Idh/MocA family oxidoreductase [Microbulbifer agarilyticus]AQQ66331.1 oxidoreductase [Microbulbifer agarilyticus]